MTSPSPPPLNRSVPRSAYIHVPFCRHRCGYCNFTLVAKRDDLIESYLQAIAQELSWLREPHEVDTLFLGGGTPTHLPRAALQQLFNLLDRWFPRAANCEFSVEANPIDLGREKAELLAASGVTRVSMGVQSFDEAKLKLLERDHRAADIATACSQLRASFADAQQPLSLSLDLIFGVPGETETIWRNDLQAALALAPDHVSTYGLTIERGTAFGSRRDRGELGPLDEELERQLYEIGIDRLKQAGFEHYEVSNFARPGHRCAHNEVYWTGGGYFAAGPGAASFLGGRRAMNHRSTTTYIRRVLSGQSPVADEEQLGPEDAARERLVFGLRRLEGVQRDQFFRQTGFEIESLGGTALQRFVQQGLLMWSDNDSLRLTQAGLMVSDALWPSFLKT